MKPDLLASMLQSFRVPKFSKKLFVCYCLWLLPLCLQIRAQNSTPGTLTPDQAAIERQKARLASSEIEERRDAILRLGAMQRVESARAAQAGLSDSAPLVRATAARVVSFLPPAEASGLLLPLLADKDEFVRQETAYALGRARSSTATQELSRLMLTDKRSSVRGAAAVALGEIGDPAASDALLVVIGGAAEEKKAKPEQNEFVIRSAARSLGQLKVERAIPGLATLLENEKSSPDVRREAATAIAVIGGPNAVAPLKSVLASPDPYVSSIAYKALKMAVQ
jgi:HEAT repeat protein